MEAIKNGVDRGIETYPLDDAAISMLSEIRQAASLQMSSVLAYFARQNNIKGTVRLADNGREVIIGQ